MYIVYAAMLLILKYNVYTDLKGFFPNHIVDSKVDPLIFYIMYLYIIKHYVLVYYGQLEGNIRRLI